MPEYRYDTKVDRYGVQKFNQQEGTHCFWFPPEISDLKTKPPLSRTILCTSGTVGEVFTQQ